MPGTFDSLKQINYTRLNPVCTKKYIYKRIQLKLKEYIAKIKHYMYI